MMQILTAAVAMLMITVTMSWSQSATNPGSQGTQGAQGMQGAPGAQNAQGGAQAIAETDRQFIISAAGGGIAEVEMGKLALEKTKNAAVKKHAQHMIDDHTKANRELEQIATAKGMQVPREPDAKHQQLLTKLQGLSGEEFDRVYMQEGGIKAHQEMQTLFRTQVEKGTDPQVKAFAQKTLPVVEEHLEHSEQIADGKSPKAHEKH